MNTNFDKKYFDELADKFLSAPSPALRKNFVDSVMNAVRLSAKEDSHNDLTADTLLAKHRDFPNITNRVIASVRKNKRVSHFSIISSSIIATLSACAAIAVMISTANSTQKKLTMGDSTYAEMARIDDEINKISFLVMQEEMLDLVRYRGK